MIMLVMHVLVHIRTNIMLIICRTTPNEIVFLNITQPKLGVTPQIQKIRF